MIRRPHYAKPEPHKAQMPANTSGLNDTTPLELALDVHAKVRETSQWLRLGTPPHVTTSELEMLQQCIKSLLQHIIKTPSDTPANRPHKAYIEALSDFRIAISIWLLQVRRGTGLGVNASMRYELHASKTEFLGKLWLNTIAAPKPSKATTKTDAPLRKFAHSGWWQSKRSVGFGWSLVPQTL